MENDFEKPSVFEYTDYRGFLKDYYRKAKEADPRYSFRFFAARAGFRSPNFLQLVMNGKRNLSEASIASLARALYLNSQALRYFRNLVLLNQSPHLEDRQRFTEQLLKSRKARTIRPLRQAQYHYYARWYFIPIRELVIHKNFREDSEWIASQLIPKIEPKEAEEALKQLEELGLLMRDPSTGCLRQSDSMIATDDEVISDAIAQYHRDAMRLAADSIRRSLEMSARFLPVPFAFRRKPAS